MPAFRIYDYLTNPGSGLFPTYRVPAAPTNYMQQGLVNGESKPDRVTLFHSSFSKSSPSPAPEQQLASRAVLCLHLLVHLAQHCPASYMTLQFSLYLGQHNGGEHASETAHDIEQACQQGQLSRVSSFVIHPDLGHARSHRNHDNGGSL